MIINPVIPIWLMIIICIALLLIRRNTLASNIRKTIAILLIFIINLRIMVPDDNVTYQERKLDTNVLFVIEISTSSRSLPPSPKIIALAAVEPFPMKLQLLIHTLQA